MSREEMQALDIRRYDGETCLVSTEAELERATADIRAEAVIGLDTETRPAFRKGESYLPCLLQAATARAVYLFQLRHVDMFPLLVELLEDERKVKAGVAIAYDLRMLNQVFPFEARNVVDLERIARSAGFEQTGVRNLAGLCLGFRIPKGNRTSNWAARQLTPAQITYAATDAWACRELYLRFEALGLLSSAPAPEPGLADAT